MRHEEWVYFIPSVLLVSQRSLEGRVGGLLSHLQITALRQPFCLFLDILLLMCFVESVIYSVAQTSLVLMAFLTARDGILRLSPPLTAVARIRHSTRQNQGGRALCHLMKGDMHHHGVLVSIPPVPISRTHSDFNTWQNER